MTRFDDIWKKWDREKLDEYIKSHEKERTRYLDLVRDHLGKAPERRVLEVGCGAAIDLHLVAEGTGCDACGVDISREALDIAKDLERYFSGKVDLRVGDARALEFADGTFDVVFSQGLIEHFERPVDILREQVRVLKPGGILIVNVPQRYTVYTLYKHLLAMRGLWEWGDETEFSSWQLSCYGRLLGLEFLEKRGYDYWRSPFELMFVLRTLNGKAGKIPLVKRCPVHDVISRFWDAVWEDIENRYGHLFMKNIVYAYRKPVE